MKRGRVSTGGLITCNGSRWKRGTAVTRMGLHGGKGGYRKVEKVETIYRGK